MTEYLGAGWLEVARDPAAEALADSGAVATVARIVTGAPDGEQRYTARIDGGAVMYEEGIGDDVDLTLTDTYANAVLLLRGEADANTLVMRGRTKVAGRTRTLLDLLAATKSEKYRAVRAEVASTVDQ